MMRTPLLEVEGLEVRFWTSRGLVHAVNGFEDAVAQIEIRAQVRHIQQGCGFRYGGCRLQHQSR